MTQQYEDQNKWKRILFTVLFWVVFHISQALLLVLVIAQSAFIIFTNNPNHHILVLSDRLTLYVQDILRYVTFNTDNRPFPFDDFPESDLIIPHSND